VTINPSAAPKESALRRSFKALFAMIFVVAGVVHFARPSGFVAIVPPYLPAPLLLVYVSGVCEVVLGGLLLAPRLSRFAAWGLVALLIAVFPANVQMALHSGANPAWTPFLRWARLPAQGLLIAWAFVYTRAPKTGRG
jgi:uncharacterized membrane protein